MKIDNNCIDFSYSMNNENYMLNYSFRYFYTLKTNLQFFKSLLRSLYISNFILLLKNYVKDIFFQTLNN